MQIPVRGSRALSPAIGVTLFIAIVVVLSALAGVLIFNLDNEEDPQPNAVLEVHQGDGSVTVVLEHEGGDTLAENRITLRGVVNDTALHGKTFRTGDEIEVIPVAEEVTVVWEGDETTYVLQTLDVPETPLTADGTGPPSNLESVDNYCEWAEQNIEANGDLGMVDDTAACDVTDDTDTGKTDINIDLTTNSVLIGDIDTDGDVDTDGSSVVGSITTDADDITITGGSVIYGDVVAQSDTNAGIDGDSTIYGDVVVRGGSLSLQDVEITGHVYADDDDISCSNTVIGPDEESCTAYDPRNPDNY